MILDLERKYPENIFNVIKAISIYADEENAPVYIVGGPVRDMFLNQLNCDLDFVVEGDGIKFSEFLHSRLKAKIKIYRAFRTATLDIRGVKVDVVTARREIYKKPAAYPTVEPADIKADLFRRDFTINAMAVGLNHRNFGRLVDFYKGYDDIKNKTIRIMHDKSFEDDPTRIFRAVRFAVRLGFGIECGTKRLMKAAVLNGYLGRVNKGRISKEMDAFLREKDPKECLRVLSKII